MAISTLFRLRAAQDPGRNAPCPCGSGKKYKKCCLGAPSRPDVSNRIIRLMREQRWSEAQELCRRVLEFTPDDADALYLLGVCAFCNDDAAAGTDFVHQAVRSDPRIAQRYRQFETAPGFRWFFVRKPV